MASTDFDLNHQGISSKPKLRIRFLYIRKEMKVGRIALFAVIVAGLAVGILGQRPAQQAIPDSQLFKTQAWGEIALRRAELVAELEALLADYTEDFPKIKEIRYALQAIEDEKKRLLAVKTPDSERLTAALGKLIVRKVELQTELWKLLQTYKDEHPDVKRAKKKVDAFEAAIKEILN